MSIISSEADSIYESSAMPGHPDLMRLLYDSDDLREAYERGAERQPTDEEIEAAIGEVRKFIMLPGGYLENIIRIAFNAARRKATEE
ncbi:hypothetical protein KSX19_02460 [Bifidobacterium longum]|uniref:hypothetical protein n=1 Tax=Bifidobacterium longum TaxID=216816 RepID=UPI001C2C7923|nr:hypothetical protein [Bifidobacterium longum]MBV3531632.1 hypothetical protein [Bifidobacterium longum]MBV3546116.1 hypothetical protein [Bifidobacterium longum]MBV3560741.1 hypothetical protein [Bifidobacterium longum]MBV3594251.1 hypothetical protein [Bifidobacterium longum]